LELRLGSVTIAARTLCAGVGSRCRCAVWAKPEDLSRLRWRWACRSAGSGIPARPDRSSRAC